MLETRKVEMRGKRGPYEMIGSGARHVLPGLLALTMLAPVKAADQRSLTWDHVFSNPTIAGTSPGRPAWSPDSRALAFLWRGSDAHARALWLVDASGKNLRMVPTPDQAPPSFSGFVWSPDGLTLVTARGRQLWSTTLATQAHVLLAELPGAPSDLSFSPDGSRLAWLQDGDLWMLEMASGEQAAVTTTLAVASPSALSVGRYSRRDREIGPGIWSGPTYAWSDDGRYLALHVVDRRHMRKVPFPNYLGQETDPNLVRRGYPGDPNEDRRVALLEVATGTLRWLELGQPTANQIIDFTWSPRGELLVDVASDTAVDRWLYTVDPSQPTPRERWHLERPSRMYTSFASAWSADGDRIIFLSDREDRYGLYEIEPGQVAGAPTRITDPAYDVLGAPSVVATNGDVYFAGNGKGPYDQHVYRRRGATGEIRQVTSKPGRHTAIPSPDGEYLAILHSADDQPTELFVSRTDGRAKVRVTHSPPPEFDAIAWGTPRYLSFPSLIDDHQLHARLLLPPEFDPERPHPVLFGPVYSNTVRNRWAGTYALVQHMLAQRGYIIAQVDVRGSTGYGRAFREAFLMDFAGDDLEDLASAVSHLATLPYVDGDRLGIWGSSYGGTLAVYSLLTKPGLFCAGVAAAAAVDPYFFGTDDVAIVRRPQSHPEIFERAARRHVDRLEDHLLLIHGMQDHVVPFKTTAELADELIKAGKDFDFAFAPGATHGWSREGPYARYLFGKLVAHFDRYLKGEGACSNGG